ncbi:hypothetical protein [[Clostridium] innocuum]
MTVSMRAKPQTWRLVRVDDGWGRARIGASPYDHVPFGERLCGEGV